MVLPNVSLIQSEIDCLGESLEPTHALFEPELPEPVQTRILSRYRKNHFGTTEVLDQTTNSRPGTQTSEREPQERTVSEAVEAWNAKLLQDITVRGPGAAAFLAEFRNTCLAVLLDEPNYARVLIDMSASGAVIDWLRQR